MTKPEDLKGKSVFKITMEGREMGRATEVER